MTAPGVSAPATWSAPHDEKVRELVDRAEVVLVSYKSRPHVEELLASWPEELRIVVVDNADNVDGLRDLTVQYANARYIDGGGQGFARAANIGARSSDRDVVVFVNPDCRPTATDLAELVVGVRRDLTAVSHAATMTGHSGEVEAGVGGWEPTLRRLLVHALGWGRRLPESGLFLAARPGCHYEVDWTTGACMAVRSSTFRSLGGFDEAFFVYAEDVSFGRVARHHGWRTVLREDVQVRHGAGSSGAPSLEMLRLRGASFAAYLVRYHRWKSVPMRALMVLGAGLRGFVATALDRRDVAAQQRAFIVGHLTRRAFVGGREVARTRLNEVAGSDSWRTTPVAKGRGSRWRSAQPPLSRESADPRLNEREKRARAG